MIAATHQPERLTPQGRRRSIVAAYANAALWGAGSGLASTTLVVYLARAHGAGGLAISWILAAPSLAGLLRLATPAWLDRVASRRRLCVALFLASAAVLALLPLLSKPGLLGSSDRAILVVAATWAWYQLLESIAAVALWSWLGDLVPKAVRGRFLGRREAWLHAGLVAGSATAIGVTVLFERLAPTSDASVATLRAYATCGFAGSVLLAVAAIVLARMSDVARAPRAEARTAFQWSILTAPLVDAKFRRFLAFGLWFSFSNGVVQAAQSIFPIAVLKLAFAPRRLLDGGLRGAKAVVLPHVGRLVDRGGNVPVLAAAQAILSLSPLFFLYASSAAPWWILGAYACWLAYAGHDVTLPNLMLGLSKPGETASYAAAWFAWTQLAYSLSTVAGGVLFDWLAVRFEPVMFGGWTVDHYALMFVVSWLLKSFGVAWAMRVPEPARR
jgi:MFS family permease